MEIREEVWDLIYLVTQYILVFYQWKNCIQFGFILKIEILRHRKYDKTSGHAKNFPCMHNNKSKYAEHRSISHPCGRHNNLSVHRHTSETSNSDYLKHHSPDSLRLGEPLENRQKPSNTMLSSTDTQSNASFERKLPPLLYKRRKKNPQNTVIIHSVTDNTSKYNLGIKEHYT